MAITSTPSAREKRRDHQIHRRASLLARLDALLKREGLSLAEARRALLPADPWEAARGVWADRRAKAERAQRKLRKEWERS